jgi:hypothetical protein
MAERRLCADPPFHAALYSAARPVGLLPLGAVIATCRLVNVLPVEVVNGRENVWGISIEPVGINELEFGDYAPGRFAWLLEEIREVYPPIPARGSLGLWDWILPATGAAATDAAPNPNLPGGDL